ncbi:YrhA family protein [Lentimicrobium saccharophilum]|nr:YrhA family protein [Lentimicrobium saccharophilum]
MRAKNTRETITRASALPFAETYKPCDTDQLEKFIDRLITSGHGWSDEITDFLTISNGFFYNGIYVYSLGSDETPDFMDMITANLQWDIADRLPGCVMFGRSDEEVYVYNQPENKFQILDLTGWDEYYAFDTMNELLEFVISERI